MKECEKAHNYTFEKNIHIYGRMCPLYDHLIIVVKILLQNKLKKRDKICSVFGMLIISLNLIFN